MRFLFETTLTMKSYNREKWWIDYDMVKPMFIDAKSVKAAIEKYRSRMDDCGVSVSKNAIRSKKPMFQTYSDGSTKQEGFVITGRTMFHDDNRQRWVDNYIDCWVCIYQVIGFEEIKEV